MLSTFSPDNPWWERHHQQEDCSLYAADTLEKHGLGIGTLIALAKEALEKTQYDVEAALNIILHSTYEHRKACALEMSGNLNTRLLKYYGDMLREHTEICTVNGLRTSPAEMALRVRTMVVADALAAPHVERLSLVGPGSSPHNDDDLLQMAHSFPLLSLKDPTAPERWQVFP